MTQGPSRWVSRGEAWYYAPGDKPDRKTAFFTTKNHKACTKALCRTMNLRASSVVLGVLGGEKRDLSTGAKGPRCFGRSHNPLKLCENSASPMCEPGKDRPGHDGPESQRFRQLVSIETGPRGDRMRAPAGQAGRWWGGGLAAPMRLPSPSRGEGVFKHRRLPR